MILKKKVHQNCPGFAKVNFSVRLKRKTAQHMQQQHIQQAIMKMVIITELITVLTSSCATVDFVFEFVCFIFFVFNLFISVFHRSRNWHRFSNRYLSRLLVGCQWVSEPILSPLLHKLIHTQVGSNSVTNLKHLFLYFQINLKIFLEWLISVRFSVYGNSSI